MVDRIIAMRQERRLGEVPHDMDAVRLRVEWRFADGARLLLLANFGEAAVAAAGAAEERGAMLYSTTGAAPGSELPPRSAAYFLHASTGR